MFKRSLIILIITFLSIKTIKTSVIPTKNRNVIENYNLQNEISRSQPPVTDCDQHFQNIIDKNETINFSIVPISTAAAAAASTINKTKNFETNQITSIESDADKTSKGERKTLVRSIYELSSGLKQFAKNLIDFIGDFSSDVQKLLIFSADKLKSVIVTLGDRILADENSALRSILLTLKEKFVYIENIFEDFIILANNEFQKVMENVNNTLITFSHEMESWSDELKDRLKGVKNDKVYVRGCKIIDRFINNTMKDMHKCCNIAIHPWTSFCKSLKDIFGDVLILTVDAVERIDSCLVENRGGDGFMHCMKQIYDRITELIDEARELKRRFIDNMPIKIMFSSCCISVTTIQSIEGKKSQLEKKLESHYHIKRTIK